MTDPEKLFEAFEELMPFRVRDILLVSSLYDSFILREDGRLNELLIGDSLELHLQHIPGITHVSSGPEAIELARSDPRFNLIVTNLTVGQMSAAELARQVKQAGLDVPVIVLAYDYREVKNFVARNPLTDIDRIFLWQGNVRILIAIIKYVEDQRNVQHDAAAMGVPVILLVEDNIRYCSSFLPVIYTEMITQSRSLLGEGLNVAHKLMRMRARPKILLCSNYEEAARQAIAYREYLFGVVSDVEFPMDGKLTPDAGFELANMVRSRCPMSLSCSTPAAPSSWRAPMPRATRFCASVRPPCWAICGGCSPTNLPLEISFSAGPTTPKWPAPKTLPVWKSAAPGSRREHRLSQRAQSLFALAAGTHRIRSRPEASSSQALRLPQRRGPSPGPHRLHRRIPARATAGPDRRLQSSAFQTNDTFFLRIGGGSLGGKARGLAFVRHLFRERQIGARFPGVRIAVPSTLVLATDVYASSSPRTTCSTSPSAAPTRENRAALHRTLLFRRISAKVAGFSRSSCTIRWRCVPPACLKIRNTSPSAVSMTPLCSPTATEIRRAPCNQLCEAIKRVYASTFSEHAKAYVRATPTGWKKKRWPSSSSRSVGAIHGERFYPDFSGVSARRTFYPVSPMTAADGVAAVALGLGREVVEGGKSLTLCPRYPQKLIQFSTVEDILANSQTDFWALELNHPSADGHRPPTLREVRYGLRVAEADGTLPHLASTYSRDNHAIYDGVSRPGPRVVTFAPILKYGAFPSPPSSTALQLLEEALGRPSNSNSPCACRSVPASSPTSVSCNAPPRCLAPVGRGHGGRRSSRLLCQSRSSSATPHSGHPRHRRRRLPPLRTFAQPGGRAPTRPSQRQAHRGRRLLSADRRRALGVDRSLAGIPVTWDQISGARVIVESGLSDLRVAPSQGSHFFQNLVAFQVGYFTINSDTGEGLVDWAWLRAQPALETRGCVRHLRLESPLLILMNGKTSRGMIIKPEGV